MVDSIPTADGSPAPTAPAASDQLSVFISYSRRDSLDFTKQLAKALELLGHKPSVDLQGISGGDEWQARLHEMILEADTVIFVLSPESAASPICAWEVEEAHRLGKRILPAIGQLLGGVKPPGRMQRLNYIHFPPMMPCRTPASATGLPSSMPRLRPTFPGYASTASC